MIGLLRKYVYQIGVVDMKIYIVVKHTDVVKNTDVGVF
jgi:hypothetical protein